MGQIANRMAVELYLKIKNKITNRIEDHKKHQVTGGKAEEKKECRQEDAHHR